MLSKRLEFLKDPFKGNGMLVVDTPTKREWVCELEPGKWQRCTKEYVDPLLDLNAGLRSHNSGKRWGDGQVVASVPMTQAMNGDMLKAIKGNDQAWLTKFLNDSDNSKYRTFEGKI